MDKRYWVGRKRPAMSTRGATSAEARLILDGPANGPHDHAHDLNFMLPDIDPATCGERMALECALPALPRPRRSYRAGRGPGGRSGDGR